MEEQFAEIVKQIETEFPGYVFDVYIAKWKQLNEVRCGISLESPVIKTCPTCGKAETKNIILSVNGKDTLAEALAEVCEKMKGLEPL